MDTYQRTLSAQRIIDDLTLCITIYWLGKPDTYINYHEGMKAIFYQWFPPVPDWLDIDVLFCDIAPTAKQNAFIKQYHVGYEINQICSLTNLPHAVVCETFMKVIRNDFLTRFSA